MRDLVRDPFEACSRNCKPSPAQLLRKRIGMISSALILSSLLYGCAKVTITPLTVDGKPSGESEGLRYYLPKPYLLVMALSGAGQQGSLPPKAPVVDPNLDFPQFRRSLSDGLPRRCLLKR
jgi:hypothetical protein